MDPSAKQFENHWSTAQSWAACSARTLQKYYVQVEHIEIRDAPMDCNFCLKTKTNASSITLNSEISKKLSENLVEKLAEVRYFKK